MASTGLADQNILVTLELGKPSGEKVKRRESNELAEEKRADASITTVKVETFKKMLSLVRKHQNAVRIYFNSRTLPWGDTSQRLVSNGIWDDLRNYLEREKIEDEKLYRAFLDALPGYIARASDPGVLGDFFDPSDFKPRDELLDKWKFRWDEATVPDAEHDIRAGWSPGQVVRMKKVWAEQSERKTRKAMRDVATRVENCLSNISDRMEKYDGTKTGSYSDTLITNIRDLTELLPAFNITNDPELEEIHRRLLSDICPLDPKELRKSDTMRSDTKSKADDLLKRIGSFGKS